MVKPKKPGFPKRKGTLKRIVKYRANPANLNKGDARTKLRDLYSAQRELLMEKDAQIRRLKSTGKLTAARARIMQEQKREIQVQLSEIRDLINGLK